MRIYTMCAQLAFWLSCLHIADENGQAKNAFDNLNGFHLQDRYLVGKSAYFL